MLQQVIVVHSTKMTQPRCNQSRIRRIRRYPHAQNPPPTRVLSISAITIFCFWLQFVRPATTFQSGLTRKQSAILYTTSNLHAAPSTMIDPASRFHADMHRVLKSRRNLMTSSQVAWNPLARGKKAHILTSDVDGTERVLSMLRHMISIGVATEESYLIALEALAKRGRLRWRRDDYSSVICAADEVTELLKELEGQSHIQILSVKTYEYALEAYASCATPRGNRKYAQHAQDLLDRMENNPNVKITPECVSHTIHAWAWQQENLTSGECARMAQTNFERLEQLSPSVATLQQSSHWLLEAWSKSNNEGSNERAGDILGKMLQIRKDHPEESTGFPNANTFSNAILAWSKAREAEAVNKAQELLDCLISTFEASNFREDMQPELIAFNGVLSAWARLGRPDMADTVLKKLEGLRSKCPELCPDLVTYNNVLLAHLKSRDKAVALETILMVVQKMEEAAKETPDVRPDSFTYSMLLKAWVQSRRPDAALRAIEALSKMRELWLAGDTAARPSNRHYNIAINALAKSRKHLDARKAHELLLQMQTSNYCRPDIITYTSVIECFSKSNDPDAADMAVELLRQASAVFDETQDPKVQPNTLTYSLVISAANCNPTLKNVERARELLSELLVLCEGSKDPNLQMNAYPFNYALNCAANCIGSSQDKLRAFQIAAQTYNDIRKCENVQPDSYTYAFWFKCCNNLLPEGDLRTKGLTLAFEQCKSDGLVSSETLRRLLAGTPEEVARYMLDVDPNLSAYEFRELSIDDLPANWSRNVR